MRRGLIHAIAWSLATGAAVTLSWWGVHTVMSGTVYDPPRALPLAGDDGTDGGTEPLSSSTHRPASSPTGKPPKPREPTKPPDTAEPSGSGTKTPKEPPPTRSGGTDAVKGYNTAGGRVVFDIGDDSASLVSATPAAGWSVQTWKQDKWIRVEFTAGAAKVSVFCTWHDTAPRVDVNTY
ncbi:hypothetical protein [Streptomyces formicae]|uniref:Putative secreted protein n=1 Tax=Streptomyces formicae TaxID=1616117 RepID=A0A291Q8D6_9ACTN|nr:hypothetical protein [Streptomyces formicae]ATL27969.1 putative secreted protein [Streptomyces formicae]